MKKIMTLEDKIRYASAATRSMKLTRIGITEKYVFVCPCGENTERHSCIGEITGNQCTLIYRCPDGSLAVAVD